MPQPGSDPASRLVRAFVGGTIELAKLAREMLVIPAQLWIFAAEIAGGAVLVAWRRVVVPVARGAWALTVAVYRLADRHATPARGVATVGVAALVALAISQWLDLSGISVGTEAYAPNIESVAPAPEVSSERTGEAHGWVMLPIAVGGLALIVAGFRGRPKLTRFLIPAGLVVIAVSLAIDAPQGLDEGTAAVAYEGAEARLLEGFWLQIACGAVLIATGLLLPHYLSSAGVRRTAGRRADAPRWSRPRGNAIGRPAEGSRG